MAVITSLCLLFNLLSKIIEVLQNPKAEAMFIDC